ncbi:MAG: metallophosphoesterase [Roseburia sp.]|nr:metallophosphoesterase [Roseburia sp.]
MIRIALMSDIHFGKFARTSEFSVPGEPIQDENRGAVSLQVGLVKTLKDMAVEYIFIAGDLTSVASPQEFHYCEEKIISIADEIGVAHEHILCCLGNHDIDRNITKISDTVIAGTELEEVANVIKEKYNLIAASCATSNFEKLSLAEKDSGPAPFSGMYEEERFIVFVLNSGWQCAHDQDYPHGKLTSGQLEWLNQITAKYKSDPRIKIVLVHHHPFKYTYPLPTQDISEIEEGSEFMDIMNVQGIDIVVHGHRHHPIAKTIQIGSGTKPITLICAGSLSVNAPHRNNGEIPNTMHILELNEDDKSIVLYNYKYTGSEGWTKLKFCNETPLDYKMKLGKIFTKEEIEEAILKLPENNSIPISWEKIDESLQYITHKELNDKLQSLLSSKYKIVGAFPEEVFFLKKEIE